MSSLTSSPLYSLGARRLRVGYQWTAERGWRRASGWRLTKSSAFSAAERQVKKWMDGEQV